MSKVSSTEIVVDPLFQKEMGKSFYDNYYSEIAPKTFEWRELSAKEKCDSILQLSNGLSIRKVLDVGCGLCNVLSRLSKLNFADEFYGIEISPSAVHFIQNNIFIPNLRAVYLEDTTKTHFDNDVFDLAILSHVLEHVQKPELLIKEALRISKYVIIEVPLEDVLIENFKAKVVSIEKHKSRKDNSVGHINFFNRQSITSLIANCGGCVINERNYSPRLLYGQVSVSTAMAYLTQNVTLLMNKLLGSMVVVSHHALLVRKEKSVL